MRCLRGRLQGGDALCRVCRVSLPRLLARPAPGRWRRPGRRGSGCRSGSRRSPPPPAARTSRRRPSRRSAGGCPGSLVQAVEQVAPASPAAAMPQGPAIRFRPLKLVTGMMPGAIGMVTPALRTWSAKRRKPSMSKKNWVMARRGAGVDLGLQHVDVVARPTGSRDALRIEADADLERRDARGCRRSARWRWRSRRRAGHRRRRSGRAGRRAGRRYGGCRRPSSRGSPRRPPRGVASTQVRCAAGVSVVSSSMRSTVRWVRSRVEPPAP